MINGSAYLDLGTSSKRKETGRDNDYLAEAPSDMVVS